jgi:UDP-N-acetylglucosamine acyltransferase
MPQIHPTAILQGDVRLADDVTIGPHCVLTGPITLGPGCALLGHVYLNGPLTMGASNRVYPFTCLGFAPQDIKLDHDRPGAGLAIGDGNVFREGVIIHRATSDTTPTRVGQGNYWMAHCHAGHDCVIGNHCIFANETLLAGFVRIDDRVITGGITTVHQFCRIGRGAILSGLMGTGRDLPPWFMLTGINVAGSVNLVGLRRSGASQEMIEDVRWVYKTLYRRDLSLQRALAELRQRAGRPMIDEYIAFIEQSKRGICPAHAQPKRGSIAVAQQSDES